MDNYMKYINSLIEEYDRLEQELQEVKNRNNSLKEDIGTINYQNKVINQKISLIDYSVKRANEIPQEIEKNDAITKIWRRIYLITILAIIIIAPISLALIGFNIFTGLWVGITGISGVVSLISLIIRDYRKNKKNNQKLKDRLADIDVSDLLSEKESLQADKNRNDEELERLQTELVNSKRKERTINEKLKNLRNVINSLKEQRQTDLEKLAAKYEPELNELFLQNGFVRERKNGENWR